jgi:hypothetical protein
MSPSHFRAQKKYSTVLEFAEDWSFGSFQGFFGLVGRQIKPFFAVFHNIN